MSFRYPAGINKPSYNGLLIPDAPTIGTASLGSVGSASVAFTPPSGTVTSYTATSSPGGFTATGASSPITVSGLSNGTSYTFTVTATNTYGTSDPSAASNSVTVPFNLLMFSWGKDDFGQLGLGNTNYYSSPKQVGSLNTWASTSTGSYSHTLATKLDGTLWSWGKNTTYGQLGLGNETSYSSPKQVGSGTYWAFVNATSYASFGIRTTGTLWAWGSGQDGQLGQGNSTNFSSPKQVGSLTNWLSIAGGIYSFVLATKTDGTLWSWGYNAKGQLGLGDQSNRLSPVQVGALTNWLQVTAGYQYSAAVKTDGTLWTWGANDFGQLGLGDSGSSTFRVSPNQVGSGTTWRQVFANGSLFMIATKTDGTLWAWGNNNNGQLGQGNTTNRSSPVQIGALTNWLIAQASSGTNSSYGIKTDGTLWAWGSGSYGQLGLNSVNSYSSPVQVGSSTAWQKFGSGNRFTTALRTA